MELYYTIHIEEKRVSEFPKKERKKNRNSDDWSLFIINNTSECTHYYTACDIFFKSYMNKESDIYILDKSKHPMWLPPPPFHKLWSFCCLPLLNFLPLKPLFLVLEINKTIHPNTLSQSSFQHVGIREWESRWKRIWWWNSHLNQTWC